MMTDLPTLSSWHPFSPDDEFDWDDDLMRLETHKNHIIARADDFWEGYSLVVIFPSGKAIATPLDEDDENDEAIAMAVKAIDRHLEKQGQLTLL